MITLVSKGGRGVGLRSAAVGDGGGSGGPVGIVLQLQGQMHVFNSRGLVSQTEQPGEEGGAPAVFGHLRATDKECESVGC